MKIFTNYLENFNEFPIIFYLNCQLIHYFRAWLNEMMALITSHELATDVAGAEALLSRHKEYKSEIDTRLENFNKFYETGENIIATGHFMADEIKDKINRLKAAFLQLQTTWERRNVIYEQNLDAQVCLNVFLTISDKITIVLIS